MTGKQFSERISPCRSFLPVGGFCPPSVLIPDWNPTRVSRYSASGKRRAISRSIASRPAMLTSSSVTPSAIASRIAWPPTSATVAPCLISAISAGDFTIRCCIAAGAMSMPRFGLRTVPNLSASSIVRWSASQPTALPVPVTEATACHMPSGAPPA
jgi:hypothetical protein